MKRILLLSLPLIFLLSLSAFAQDAQQNLTLIDSRPAKPNSDCPDERQVLCGH